MSQEEKMYCPSMLKLQTKTLMLDIDRHIGEFYQRPVDSLEDRGIIQYSLHNFVNYINNIPLTAYLSDFLKGNQEIPDGNLFLQPVLGNPYYSPTWLGFNKGMYLDGAYGFILCLQPDRRTRPLLLAVTSFYPGTSLYLYSEGAVSYPDITTPVILQLQSQHWFTNDKPGEKALAASVLKSFRWEHALIYMDVKWAQSVGLPAIHILPSWQNRYFRGKEDTMKMRYDVSAERCGFKKDERGLYTLPLPTSLPKPAD